MIVRHRHRNDSNA